MKTRTALVAKGYNTRHGRNYATIRAVWHGGAYVDLAFNGAHASEVINVWDYATNRSTIGDIENVQRGTVRRVLLAWIADNDAEESHDANGHDTERPPRQWLASYVENLAY